MIFIVVLLDNSGAPSEAQLPRVGMFMSASVKTTQVGVWIFPNTQILEFSELSRWQLSDVFTDGEPPVASADSCQQSFLKRTAQILRRLAASADAADLAVDVRILLIKDIPGD
jgi:hypothetical protein